MTVMEQEITAYVERVRAALADLPPAQRDELTEDLSEHLAEVAAESGGSLVDRLGEPEAYAAELRAAAGAPVRTGPNLDQRVAGLVVGVRTRLRTLDVRLGPPLGYATASEYLRLLRPAWWLVRAYLAAMLVTAVSTGGTFGVLPSLGGSHLAGLVLLAACVVGSLWLGRNADRLARWPRRLVLVGSLGLAFFGLVGAATVDGRARWGGYQGYDSVSVNDQYSHIRDVFVYDSEGRLVRDVRLFDQDGTPIRLGWPDYCRTPGPEQVDESIRRTYPYCPEQAPFQFRTDPTSAPTPGGPTTTPDATPSDPTGPDATPSEPANNATPSGTGTPDAPTGPGDGPAPAPTESGPAR
ncbi:HAAS signaling domain-containing protein [Micromonospora sp. NPDC050187]|uniref:HAAS signaling domain-containing protein n=1 Tax=Micromonospora sp. NPDC050187 TaxID=3364277 RepID=UPI0037A19E88